MSYKCPRCGGTDYYMQQVQVGSQVIDFNPTDSLNVTNDLIPNSMQVPGQAFVNPVMKTIAFCKTCPTPVQMLELKPPKKPFTWRRLLKNLAIAYGIAGVLALILILLLR